MRGQQERTGSLFSSISIKDRIPASHPLRRIRKLADQAFDRLNPSFCQLYASEGRPSVQPEQLMLASLLQAFYGIRLERLLLEQLNYSLMFRWSVGLSPDDPIWHPAKFTHESCAPAQRAGDGQVPGEADGSSGGESAAQQRAFLCGRHPAASLGLSRLFGANRRRG